MNETLSHELNTSIVRINILEWMEFVPHKTVYLACETADVIVNFLREKELQVTLAKDKTEDAAECYDYVIWIEDPLYPGKSINDTEIAEAKALLNPGGVLILAVSNRLGMKYLNGGISAEGQQPYDGIASQTQVTKHELDKYLKENGFAFVKYYYPVPDHVFATQIFSDDFLPGLGDLREIHPDIGMVGL